MARRKKTPIKNAGLGGSAGGQARPGMLDSSRGDKGPSLNKANKGVNLMLPFNANAVEKRKNPGNMLPPDGAGGGGGRGYGGGGGGYGGGGGGYGGGGGGGGGAPKTSSKGEARAVLYAGLQSILGRKPTPAEVDAYYKALGVFETKAGEEQNPLSSAQRELFTSDWIDADADLHAERGAYETATKYFDAFAKAIQSPVNIR